jgi:hypothetical protein
MLPGVMSSVTDTCTSIDPPSELIEAVPVDQSGVRRVEWVDQRDVTARVGHEPLDVVHPAVVRAHLAHADHALRVRRIILPRHQPRDLAAELGKVESDSLSLVRRLVRTGGTGSSSRTSRPLGSRVTSLLNEMLFAA